MPEMKPLEWLGSSRRDLRECPEATRQAVGYALYEAQVGRRATNTKVLKGFHGAGVVEIVADHQGDAYRAVYTVRFAEAVYVLHVFQKKSKRGIATPRADLELIRTRLTAAEALHAQWLATRGQAS